MTAPKGTKTPAASKTQAQATAIKKVVELKKEENNMTSKAQEATQKTSKEATKKVAAPKETLAQATTPTKTEKVEAIKKVSNTQRCATMILEAAHAATATRKEVEATMIHLFPELSKVSIKTLLSDLQNAKYAKRYSKATIAFEDTTGKIKLGTPIAS